MCLIKQSILYVLSNVLYYKKGCYKSKSIKSLIKKGLDLKIKLKN